MKISVSHQKTLSRLSRYADRVWTRLVPPYPLTPGALVQPYNTISRFRVPVSTTEDPCPELGIRPVDIGDVDQIFRAIKTLKVYGWTVGCDAELLPPNWFWEEL